MSHPAWVCGLKRIVSIAKLNHIRVTPCVGVWIETPLGLIVVVDSMSHPAWVCGLKRPQQLNSIFVPQVTPCVGVWIETLIYANIQSNRGHTLRGCVD